MRCFPCPCGGHHSKVHDSRPSGEGAARKGQYYVRRVRICDGCGKRITTCEMEVVGSHPDAQRVREIVDDAAIGRRVRKLLGMIQ